MITIIRNYGRPVKEEMAPNRTVGAQIRLARGPTDDDYVPDGDTGDQNEEDQRNEPTMLRQKQ
jgi:hypothetical protein